MKDDILAGLLIAFGVMFATVCAAMLGIGLTALGGFVLFLAWNQVVPSLLGGPTVTFFQAWGLSVLVNVVTGAFANFNGQLYKVVTTQIQQAKAQQS